MIDRKTALVTGSSSGIGLGIARGQTEEEVKRDVLLAAQPTRKFAPVEEFGALAAFLTTDGAASITGAALHVDGGWTAQ